MAEKTLAEIAEATWVQGDGWNWQAVADAVIAAHESRRALEEAPDYIDNPMTGDAASMLRRYVHAALAASHDDHARRIKAEALADIMRKICAVAVQTEERESRTFSWSEAATIIHDEVSELESPNGRT